jgi:putative sterol carrier protein
MDQLDTLTRRGSNESIAAPHHESRVAASSIRLHARKGDFPSTYKTRSGKIHNPNVSFVASDEDWVAMSNKTLKVSLAYLTGRLKIQGSHGLVKELDKIFP